MCISCHKDRSNISPEFFEAQYRAMLENVRTNIPKVFVNAVLMFNISGVYQQLLDDKYCMFVQSHFKECPCMMMEDADRLTMDEHGRQYNAVIRSIADDYESRNYTDFRVVVQPALENLKVLDREFLSGVDVSRTPRRRPC